MSVFRKHMPGADPWFFRAEAAGLRWLGEAGLPVVGVRAVGSDFIELERLAAAHPSTAHAREFGASLARAHSAGATGFGAPPDGYDGTLFIGKQTMPSRVRPTWEPSTPTTGCCRSCGARSGCGWSSRRRYRQSSACAS
jgi:fructosamine-3-kinase